MLAPLATTGGMEPLLLDASISLGLSCLLMLLLLLLVAVVVVVVLTFMGREGLEPAETR